MMNYSYSKNHKSITIEVDAFKKLLFIVLFLYPGNSILISQILDIPDPNLKAALIDQGVDSNSDGEIDVTEALATEILQLSEYGISDVSGIDRFSNLKLLFLSFNSISSINIDSLSNLEMLAVDNNLLQNINLPKLTNLKLLDLADNQLTKIVIRDTLSSLNYLDVSRNLLDNLSWDLLPGLFDLQIAENNFETLDLSANQGFGLFNCSNNPIQNIEFPPSISSLFINETSLHTIDLTGVEVNLLTAEFNSNLEVLFLRNGYREINPSLNHNPKLKFICADDGAEIEWLERYIDFLDYDIVLSNDCTVDTQDISSEASKLSYNQDSKILTLSDKLSSIPFYVYNLEGRLLAKSYEQEYDMSSYPSSIYFVKIGKNKRSTFKITVL